LTTESSSVRTSVELGEREKNRVRNPERLGGAYLVAMAFDSEAATLRISVVKISIEEGSIASGGFKGQIQTSNNVKLTEGKKEKAVADAKKSGKRFRSSSRGHSDRGVVRGKSLHS